MFYYTRLKELASQAVTTKATISAECEACLNIVRESELKTRIGKEEINHAEYEARIRIKRDAIRAEAQYLEEIAEEIRAVLQCIQIEIDEYAQTEIEDFTRIS